MSRSLESILRSAKVIAVIGCSDKAYRTSHQITEYLKNEGYRVIPVNPNYNQVLGEKCYDSVTDIPEEIQIDVVDIFRNSKYTAKMVEEVMERVEKTGRKPVIWTQLSVSSQEAKELAQSGGLQYIRERCIMVDHQRLLKSV